MSTQAAGNARLAHSNSYAWYATIILTIAFTLSYIDRQILGVMVEPIRRDLGITDTEFSILQGAAFAISFTIFTVPAGWLTDRMSRSNLMSGGVFVWSIMTAFSGLAQNFLQLFGARAAVGMGEAVITPAANSILADYFPRDKLATPIAFFAASPFIGVGLAFMLGGPLVQYLEGKPPIDVAVVGQIYSWQIVFFIVGLPGILVALLVFLLREPARKGLMASEKAGITKVPASEIFKFLRVRKKFFLLLMLGFSGLSIQGYALFAWVTSFFVRVHDVSRADATLTYGAIALVVGVAGSIFGGFRASQLMQQGRADATLRLVMYSAIVVTPLAVALGLAPHAWIAFVLLVPITFCMAMPPGLVYTALQVITPNELRGQVLASYLLITNFVSFLLAPLVIALLTEKLYQDDAAVGLSLSTLAAITYPTAAICMAFALKHFREAYKKAETWS